MEPIKSKKFINNRLQVLLAKITERVVTFQILGYFKFRYNLESSDYIADACHCRKNGLNIILSFHKIHLQKTKNNKKN